MTRCKANAAALTALALASLIAAPSQAEWPTARHDPQRTAASLNTSNITKPAQYWRSYLGAALGSSTFLVGDANSDGNLDVLYVAGGRLLLAQPDGQVLWQTPNMGFATIPDALDFDNDGTLDVVVNSSSQSSLVNGHTGQIVWTSTEPLGVLAATRIADFNGDGFTDLFLDSCGGCCAVNFNSPGILYSFPNGFDAPQVLGQPPPRQHCNAAADTIGDWDGDGFADLVVATNDTLLFLHGVDTQLGESAPIALYIGGVRCQAVNIDGLAGDELICLQNTVVVNQGQRAVFALAYRPQNPQNPIELLWNQVLAPFDQGDLRPPNQLVFDLDKDGLLEVVASGKDGQQWTTFVLDALTGMQISSIQGHLAYAVVEHQSDKPPFIVTVNPDTNLMVGWNFQRNPATLEPVWQLPDKSPSSAFNRPFARRSGLFNSAVTLDLDADGRQDLIAESITEPTTLVAYSLSSQDPFELATYPLDNGVGLVALGTVSADITTPVKLALSRNDGYLALLDGALVPTNAGQEGNETLPGMRAGAYYTGSGGLFSFGRAPIAARMQPNLTAESLFVVDAGGDLLRIDADAASNVSPAKAVWQAQDSFGASIAPEFPGGPMRIASFRQHHPITEPPAFSITVLNEAAETVADIPMDRPPAWDVLPGDLNGDGLIDFAALTAEPTFSTQLIALNASGELWRQNITASYGTSPIALVDWDQTDGDDVVVAVDTVQVFQGTTGNLLNGSSGFLAYFMPLLADVNSDAAPDVTLQGGLYGTRTFDHDLSTLLWQGEEDRPYPYGAIASCAGTQHLVEGSLSFPARLAITTLSGPQAGQRTTLVLASGKQFIDEDQANQNNATLGQLGDVAVSPNLSGADSAPTALVGSTDGFLYAVNVCTANLTWSYNFEVPVGAPILADPDGDGSDDIVVSVADGYLYGLRHEVLPDPAFVWDVDIPHGLTSEDIDEIDTQNTLYAVWDPVPEATSYEVAVVGAAGTYLTTPPWIDVGNVTQTTLESIPLNDGAKYYVGVRAVSAKGRSPDRPSDGVIVHVQGSGTGGSGGGGTGSGGKGIDGDEHLLWGRACVCHVASADRSSPIALWIAMGMFAGCIVRRTTRQAKDE